MSWTPIPGGYSLFFNRDERHTRSPGHPPTLLERSGVGFLAPTDADAGGTWIGVNQFGLTVSLLNRYHETPIDAGTRWTSRGLLVLSLLPEPAADRVVRTLRERDLGEFQPFTICAVDRGLRVHLADWTGTELRTERTDRPGMIRTSSGRDQREAERSRSVVQIGLMPDRNAITPGDLDRFHRSHLPERGPFSVCMHRPEAETRSLTSIEVTEIEARLDYVAGSPCLGAAPIGARLALVPAA